MNEIVLLNRGPKAGDQYKLSELIYSLVLSGAHAIDGKPGMRDLSLSSMRPSPSFLPSPASSQARSFLPSFPAQHSGSFLLSFLLRPAARLVPSFLPSFPGQQPGSFLPSFRAIVMAATVPRFTVKLDAPAATRWDHVIAPYSSQLKAVEKLVDSTLTELAPRLGSFASSFIQLVTSAANRSGKVYYHEELAGIAAKADMPVGKLVAMQLIYEAAAHCTSVIVPVRVATAHRVSGGDDVLPAAAASSYSSSSLDLTRVVMAHIRTMDWEMDFLRPLTIEVDMTRNDRVVCTGTTWVGYVGLLTGFASRVDTTANSDETTVTETVAPPARSGDRRTSSSSCSFSLSVNFRSVGSGTFWTNVSKALGDSWPIGFLARETLTEAVGYEQALSWLRSSKLIAPCYFSVCGATLGQAALVTRDRDTEEQFWPFQQRGHIVQPNMDHWSHDPEESIMMSVQRRDVVQRYIERFAVGRIPISELTSQPQGDSTSLAMDAPSSGFGSVPIMPTVESLWDLMSEVPVCNEITVYGTLMLPSLGTLVTRLPLPGYRFSVPPSVLGSTAARGTIFAPTEAPAYPTCVRCHATFDPALNPPGSCTHTGTWHERYADCSYLKCGFGLGPSGIGKQHWSCCYSTVQASACPKSLAHGGSSS